MEVKKDIIEDEPEAPNGDTKAKMEEYSERYYIGPSLDDDIRNIGKFGHINKRTGEYVKHV